MSKPEQPPAEPALNAGSAYTFRQGGSLVTVVTDGCISVPEAVVTAGADPVEREAINDRLPKIATGVLAEANIPIVQTGSGVSVFDVGGGGRDQPTEGRFGGDLLEIGISASIVTKVVLTHAHSDHVLGIQDKNGAIVFPNATYYIDRAEWAFWMRDFAYGTRGALSVIDDRVCLSQSGQDVATGLRAMETPGHTPGHLSFELAGDEGLLIANGVATSVIVLFEHPEWVFGFDKLPDVAISTRQRFLDRAAIDRHQLLGYQWRYPGIGYAEREEKRFGSFRVFDGSSPDWKRRQWDQSNLERA